MQAGARKAPYRRTLPAPRHCVPHRQRLCPGKRAVRMNQHRRDLHRAYVALLEGFDNDFPVWYSYSPAISAVVISRVRGSHRRNSPRASFPTRVNPAPPATRWWRGGNGYAQCRQFPGNDDTARDGSGCRRRVFTPLDHFTRGDIYHHHIFCGHHVVLHAGWFDHHHAAVTVNRADVAR